MADINVEEVLGKLSLAEKIDLLAGKSLSSTLYDDGIQPLTWMPRHRFLAHQGSP
jgi:hypothetical protein